MGFVTYKQYDSRWGSKNYNGSSTMATAGCGPTACAILISGIKPKVTPLQTMKYMQEHGYAIRNQGTAWNGIPACLKFYGYKDVHEVTTMDKLWEVMAKGYKAVILFSAGTRGGITWTTAGHFVAATAYKKRYGKHYLWMRDPGPRNREKWYCYEDYMKGLIRKIWVGKPPEKKPTDLEKIVQGAKKYAWKHGTPYSKYSYPSGKRKKAYVHALKIAFGYRRGWRDQTKKGASCDVFVAAVIRAMGIDKQFPRGCDDIPRYVKSSHFKKKWKRRYIYKWRKWKPGYVIYQEYKTGGKHIFIYLGNGWVANAHYVKKTYPIIERASKIVKSKSNCNRFYVMEPR